VTASAYLAADRPAEAQGEIEQGLSLASERRARGYRAQLLRLRGEALACRPAEDTGRARQCLDEALAVATELGMRPEIAHCHAGLAWVHRRAGERSAAETHLATATALFRDLGMTFWAIRADAASQDRT
jgi:hypothetical protein